MGPGSHQRAPFPPLLSHREAPAIASLRICTVTACPASGRLWHLSGVATRLASFPPPSLKPGLTGVLCSHSKGSIESSQMRAGVGSYPAPGTAWSAGVAQPTKCQRALPATALEPVPAGQGQVCRKGPSKYPLERLRSVGSSLILGLRNTRHFPGKQATCRLLSSHPKFFPKMPPSGAGLVGGPAAPPLFTFFLQRGQRAGPARESPDRQVGEVGGMGPKPS